MSVKFCETCGSALADGAKFCNNCGRITSAAPPPPPPAPAAPAQQAYANPAPAAYSGGSAAQPAIHTAVQQQTAQYSAPAQSYAPPAQQQTYYQAPQQNYYQKPQDTAPMTVGQYILMMFISAIPLVGFIMLLIWAFGSDTNANKKNYARAVLILSVIGIVFCIIFGTVITGIIASIISSSSGGYYGY